MDAAYAQTVRLLLNVAPDVFANDIFAMKGGTAINLFVQEMPRLSVDIDVMYVPWDTPREAALQAIAQELHAIAQRLQRQGLLSRTIASHGLGDTKLIVEDDQTQVKVEVNAVFRGTVMPTERRALCTSTAEMFSVQLEVHLNSMDENTMSQDAHGRSSNRMDKANELLEEIRAELSETPKRTPAHRPKETTKDYLARILEKIKEVDDRSIDERDAKSYANASALLGLAMLALLFLFHNLAGVSDWQWLNDHRFALRLWGVALAAVFVGVSIEQTSFFRTLWDFRITKVVASLAVSSLVIFSTGKASTLINAVFMVDASELPLTRAIVTGCLAFRYSYPLLVVVGFFAIFHVLNMIAWWHKKNSDAVSGEMPVHSIVYLILALVVMTYFSKWEYRDFADDAMPAKIYKLAHVLDFDSKYQCRNIPQGLSVLFLRNGMVLVDPNVYAPQENGIESLVNATYSNNVIIPQRFAVVRCDL